MKKLASAILLLITIVISPHLFAETASGSTTCVYYNKKPYNFSENASKAKAYENAVITAKQSCMRSMNLFVAYYIEIVSENSVNEEAQSGGQCWETRTYVRFSCLD